LQTKYFEASRDFLDTLYKMNGPLTLYDFLKLYPKGLNYQDFIGSGKLSQFDHIVPFPDTLRFMMPSSPVNSKNDTFRKAVSFTMKESHFLINDMTDFTETVSVVAVPKDANLCDNEQIVKVHERWAPDEIEEKTIEDDASEFGGGGWRGPKKKPVPIGSMNLKADILPTIHSLAAGEEEDVSMSKPTIHSFDIELPN